MAVVNQVRTDRWLWAARFFKTRGAATEAVLGGWVHVNGERVKPSKFVRAGDTVEVTIGTARWTVAVVEVAERHGPASVAASERSAPPFLLELVPRPPKLSLELSDPGAQLGDRGARRRAAPPAKLDRIEPAVMERAHPTRRVRQRATRLTAAILGGAPRPRTLTVTTSHVA